MSGLQDHYTIIEYNGVRKRTHWKGNLTVKDFINLLENLFKVSRKAAPPEAVWISWSENGTGNAKVGLKEFVDRKLMNSVGAISVVLGSQAKKSQGQEKPNGNPTYEAPKPKATRLHPTGSAKTMASNLKERASHPAQSRFEASQFEHEMSPKHQSVTHEDGGDRFEEDITLKSSDIVTDHQASVVNSQDELPMDRITLQALHIDFVYRLLGKMNKVAVLHTVKSRKIAANIMKLVPLAGKVIPTIIHNRVATHQDESLELNVNNEFCFILKVNENIISNMHIYIEALNKPNCLEYLLQKFTMEQYRSEIIEEAVTLEEFTLLIKNAGCTRDQFIEALSKETGKVFSQGLLDLLLSICYDLYKCKSAKIIHKFAVKENESADLARSTAIKEDLIRLIKQVYYDLDLSVDLSYLALPR